MFPVELLGIAGFGFAIGWMLITYYWLFCGLPVSAVDRDPVAVRDFLQLWVFVGNACGFFALHALGKKIDYNLFSFPTIIVEGAFSVAFPLYVLVLSEGSLATLSGVCVLSALSGFAGAFLTISWLDICSRLKTKRYGRFMGLSFLLGCLAFFLASQTDFPSGALFAILYAAASILLLIYTTATADANDERFPLGLATQRWSSQKEIEPSFFMFNAVFGMTFAWLFFAGETAVLCGLLSVIPGAIIIASLSMLRIDVNITMVLRVLLCLCVLACVFMTQSNDLGRLICSCIVVTIWTVFTSLNYSFLVRKSVVMRDAPFFRQTALRLAVPASGFAFGWLVILIGTITFGAGSDSFITVRLAFAVMLVTVFVMFFPTQEHHSLDGASDKDSSETAAHGLDTQELFALKTKSIAKKHKLSPRETEILSFLARGRNVAYIQERLVVSPHTVRTHMHNIYKKLDVHSQQELIDAVEEYEPDQEDIVQNI